MAIEYYDGTNGDGLFNILGKIFQAQLALNTARGTTVPQDILDAVNQYKKKTDADLQMDRSIQGLATAEQSWRNNGNALARQLQRTAQNLIIEVVRADSPIALQTLDASLRYLIDAMIADEYYVDANTVGSSVSADGGNSSTDVSLAVTRYNGDAELQQNMLAEDLVITAEGSGSSTQLRIVGESIVSDLLSELWPGGSGVNQLIPMLGLGDSIVGNAGFETETIDDLPDGWIFEPIGTGTTYRLTVYTEQTIIISGTPASGHYNVIFTDPITGNDYATDNLPFNATSAQLQTALRTLPGLGSVTVSSTGTSPNLTHTVVFTGVAAAVAEMASLEAFNTGSIAHAVTVAGDAGAISGRGLVIEGGGDGMVFYYPIRPAARQLYTLAAHFYAGVSGVYSISMEVVDGIGGSAVPSQSGTAFTSTLGATGALNAWLKSWFALADTVQLPVYLKITVDAVEDVVVDNVIVSPTQTQYAGGPTVVAYRGKVAPAAGDKWTVATTNNGAGAIQTMMHRNCDMASKRLLIPTSGSTAIPDSVIA